MSWSRRCFAALPRKARHFGASPSGAVVEMWLLWQLAAPRVRCFALCASPATRRSPPSRAWSARRVSLGWVGNVVVRLDGARRMRLLGPRYRSMLLLGQGGGQARAGHVRKRGQPCGAQRNVGSPRGPHLIVSTSTDIRPHMTLGILARNPRHKLPLAYLHERLLVLHLQLLFQGGVKFPTGGKSGGAKGAPWRRRGVCVRADESATRACVGSHTG